MFFVLKGMMRKRIINVALQGTTLLIKFGLIFLLAKYLSPIDIGYYGLFVAAISYSLYFVGLDFYTYVTREVVRTPKSEQGALLRSQASLSVFLYLIFIPILFIILTKKTSWPSYLIWWFIPLLVVEHFNQEMSRLFVALSEQVFASILLFVRQASWAVFVMFTMYFVPETRSLEFPLKAWFVSGLLAVFLSSYKLYRLGIRGWGKELDWKWIKKGILVSGAFLSATLALRGVQTFDRYILESIGGLEIVGAYVLFSGIAGSLLAFLDSGVFSFTYPALIDLSQRQMWSQMRRKTLNMFFLTIFLSFAFSVVSLLIIPYLLAWIGKELYSGSIELYYWILLATVVNALGLVPHYALYSANKDKPIIISHLLAFFVFFIAVFLLRPLSFYMSVPQALFITFLFIFVFKTAAYLVIIPSKAVEGN